MNAPKTQKHTNTQTLKYSNLNPNYDKFPTVKITGHDDACWAGWDAILGKIKTEIARRGQQKTTIVVETYPGANDQEITAARKTACHPMLFFRRRMPF